MIHTFSEANAFRAPEKGVGIPRPAGPEKRVFRAPESRPRKVHGKKVEVCTQNVKVHGNSTFRSGTRFRARKA
jgi:hypothetical protein